MSVTPPVFHVEMWPRVASAAVASESHAATAILIFPLAMAFPCPPHVHVVVHAPAEVLVER